MGVQTLSIMSTGGADTRHPQYQALNFTKSTCLRGGVGGFAIPTPKQIPPIFFLRGTTVTFKAVCTTNPDCLLQLGRNPMAVHDPTSSSVRSLSSRPTIRGRCSFRARSTSIVTR